MSTTTQEKIVQLEKEANKLVNNLDLLYKKAGSYNTAKEELQKTNDQLLQFINETKNLGEESHKIISKLNEIGASQLFKQLEKVDKSVLNLNSNIQHQFNKNKIIYAGIIILITITLIINLLLYLK